MGETRLPGDPAKELIGPDWNKAPQHVKRERQVNAVLDLRAMAIDAAIRADAHMASCTVCGTRIPSKQLGPMAELGTKGGLIFMFCEKGLYLFRKHAGADEVARILSKAQDYARAPIADVRTHDDGRVEIERGDGTVEET
jgi:hypothetical protein